MFFWVVAHLFTHMSKQQTDQQNPVITTAIATIAVDTTAPTVVESLASETRAQRIAIGGGFKVPARRNRGRKRPAETVIDLSQLANVNKRKKKSLNQLYAEGTKDVYVSYIRTIFEWYGKNHPSVVDPKTGEIDRMKFHEIIRDEDKLLNESNIFHTFLESRPHHKFKKPDGTPQRALIGTLNGYRCFVMANIFCVTNAPQKKICFSTIIQSDYVKYFFAPIKLQEFLWRICCVAHVVAHLLWRKYHVLWRKYHCGANIIDPQLISDTTFMFPCLQVL